MDAVERITRQLAGLEAGLIEIDDESEMHRGHAGASGGGHYALTVVSEKFRGQKAMARHRMIYGMLSGMMKGEIHALSISAYTPEEYQSKQNPPT